MSDCLTVLKEDAPVPVPIRLPFENVTHLRVSEKALFIKLDCHPINIISPRPIRQNRAPWIRIEQEASIGDLSTDLVCLFALTKNVLHQLKMAEDPRPTEKHQAKKIKWSDFEDSSTDNGVIMVDAAPNSQSRSAPQ